MCNVRGDEPSFSRLSTHPQRVHHDVGIGTRSALHSLIDGEIHEPRICTPLRILSLRVSVHILFITAVCQASPYSREEMVGTAIVLKRNHLTQISQMSSHFILLPAAEAAFAVHLQRGWKEHTRDKQEHRK